MPGDMKIDLRIRTFCHFGAAAKASFLVSPLKRATEIFSILLPRRERQGYDRLRRRIQYFTRRVLFPRFVVIAPLFTTGSVALIKSEQGGLPSLFRFGFNHSPPAAKASFW